MVFEVHLKKECGNEINSHLSEHGDIMVGKHFNVTALNITDGLLKKGNYYLPLSCIIYINEV